MINAEFHELAEKELIDARNYYDDLVYGLGYKFILDAEHILNRITYNPFSFPVYFDNYRIALLRKFPYSIIFKEDNSIIFILAVAHQKRKPRYYLKRLKK